jgi:hypothetical protein
MLPDEEPEQGLDQGWWTYGYGKISLAHSINCCPNFFLVTWPASLHCEEYVYKHIYACAETVHELPLLPNNTASATLLHELGVVQSVGLIHIIVAAAWRWLGEYVTLDRTFYNLPGKWPTWRTILFYVFIFIFNSLHVSSTPGSSSAETNCVNTTSGSCHSVSVAVSCAGWKWTSDLSLLMMSTMCLKHVDS